MIENPAAEVVETDHLSQSTLDLLRKRTDGVPFILTGRRGLGGGYSRLLEYLVVQRKLVAAGYRAYHKAQDNQSLNWRYSLTR